MLNRVRVVMVSVRGYCAANAENSSRVQVSVMS